MSGPTGGPNGELQNLHLGALGSVRQNRRSRLARRSLVSRPRASSSPSIWFGQYVRSGKSVRRIQAMNEPIVFISRFRLRDGQADAFAAAFSDAAASIAVGKPRTSLYAAYLDETNSDVRIVHAFPDAAAMTAHFTGSDKRAASIAGLVEYAGFQVLGRAPAAAVGQLRAEAGALGVGLELHPRSLGGFIRGTA